MRYFTYQSNYELYRAVKRIKTELKLTWRDIAEIAETDEKKLYKWIALHKKAKVSGAIISEASLKLMAERLGLKLVTSLVQNPITPEWKRNINNIINDRKYRNAKKRNVPPVSRATRVYRQAREQ